MRRLFRVLRVLAATAIIVAVAGQFAPLLNPAQEAGYGGVAVYVIAIASFILLVGAGIIALSRTPWPHEPAEPARPADDVEHARA